MSGPVLTVGKGVIKELVKTAAFEVPGVVRVGYGGPRWRAWQYWRGTSARACGTRTWRSRTIVSGSARSGTSWSF